MNQASRPRKGPASFLPGKEQYIAALPGGQLDPDLEVLLAGKLPMTLRRVERTDERASDYQIDIGGWVDFGFGWSRTTPSQESPTSPSWSNTGSAPGFRASHDNRRTTKDGGLRSSSRSRP